MWGYQQHFRNQVELRAKRIFQRLGVEVEPKVLLVGLRRIGLPPGHPVCIDPEDGMWPLALFEKLGDEVEKAIRVHPQQNMYYGDERTMREKPERIRHLALSDQINICLNQKYKNQSLMHFCSTAYPVADYDVVCVIQIPQKLYEQFPPVIVDYDGNPYEISLIRSNIELLLDEARHGLALPDPGRSLWDSGMRDAEEIVARAASSFMRNAFIAGERPMLSLFDDVNRLSKAQYEGQRGIGRLILAAAGDPNVEYVVRLSREVALSDTRWARKLLQMATTETALIVGPESISGLGKLSDLSTSPYCIDLLDHHQWEFRCGEQVLLRSRFGEVQLPQEPIGRERFIDNMRRVFEGIGESSIVRFRSVLDILIRLRHGSSLVIAVDAESEAQRLSRQGTTIVPTPLSRSLIERATEIDGTILADVNGVCHAIGVILDGQASEESTPSRGARYNSVVRYVGAGKASRMAFIISEDRTLDVVPLLRPRLERSRIAAALDELNSATIDNYHRARAFVDEFRFYFNAEQCKIANAALDRIERLPRDVGRIVIITRRLEPHPGMNDSYLK
jgi:hypothetical protein